MILNLHRCCCGCWALNSPFEWLNIRMIVLGPRTTDRFIIYIRNSYYKIYRIVFIGFITGTSKYVCCIRDSGSRTVYVIAYVRAREKQTELESNRLKIYHGILITIKWNKNRFTRDRKYVSLEVHSCCACSNLLYAEVEKKRGKNCLFVIIIILECHDLLLLLLLQVFTDSGHHQTKGTLCYRNELDERQNRLVGFCLLWPSQMIRQSVCSLSPCHGYPLA